jgi:hypothetical protein
MEGRRDGRGMRDGEMERSRDGEMDEWWDGRAERSRLQ